MTDVLVKDSLSNTILRSVNDKVFDIVSSKDFGGISDGSTDDTAAINSGLASLGTGVLILPPFTIYTEASIVFPSSAVVIFDLSQPGRLRILSSDTGFATPITAGGIEVKTQGHDSILLHTHDGGVSGNPYLQILDAITGNLAGVFAAFVLLNNYLDITQQAEPNAPGAGVGRLFIQDNGSGKSQLAIRFNTGAVQVLATQP